MGITTGELRKCGAAREAIPGLEVAIGGGTTTAKGSQVVDGQGLAATRIISEEEEVFGSLAATFMDSGVVAVGVAALPTKEEEVFGSLAVTLMDSGVVAGSVAALPTEEVSCSDYDSEVVGSLAATLMDLGVVAGSVAALPTKEVYRKESEVVGTRMDLEERLVRMDLEERGVAGAVAALPTKDGNCLDSERWLDGSSSTPQVLGLNPRRSEFQASNNGIGKRMDKEKENINMLVFIAVVLDPRYKLSEYVELAVEEMYGQGIGQKIWSALNKCLHDLFEEYRSI